jgi:hypothetical protein
MILWFDNMIQVYIIYFVSCQKSIFVFFLISSFNIMFFYLFIFIYYFFNFIFLYKIFIEFYHYCVDFFFNLPGK